MNIIAEKYNIFRKSIIENKINKLIFISSVYFLIIFINLIFTSINYFKIKSNPRLLFDLIVLLYFFIIVTFLMILFFKINKSNFSKYSGLIIFISSFLFLLFWIPFGIDLTDEGKQMSISWFLFNGEIPHSYNYNKIGSWIVNGLWLNIIRTPFMLWERLGGVLVMSLMTLFSYKILKLYKNDIYTFFITLVILFLIICRNHPETKIDHSNFPTLLAIISIYLMLLYVKPDYSFNGKVIYNILSSLIMVISIAARYPHILFLIFPLIFFIICIFKYQIKGKKIITASVSYYLPVFLLLIIGLLYLFVSGKFEGDFIKKVLDSISGQFKSLGRIFNIDYLIWNDNNKLSTFSYPLFLLKKYLKDFIYILSLAVIFFIGLFSLEKIYRTYNKSRLYSNKIDNTLFLFLGIILFIGMLLKPWMWYMSIFGFIIAFLTIIMIRRINLKNEFFYLYWGVLLIIISFIGSNNSFRHSVPAGAVFILFSITALLNKSRLDFFKEKNMLFLNKFTILFFIVILFISGYKKLFDNNKRDKMIYQLNKMYDSPELFGIFSSTERVDAIDGIIRAAKEHMAKNSTLLCFNSVPMLHYLLNKDYYLDDPWIIIEGYSTVGKRLVKDKIKNKYPDFIIFSKKSAKENSWPDTDVFFDAKDKQLYDYLVEYIKESKYNNIYENDAFILYKK